MKKKVKRKLREVRPALVDKLEHLERRKATKEKKPKYIHTSARNQSGIVPAKKINN